MSETLAGVWVAGEVRRISRSRAGHLYFELVEKGDGDSIVGSMQAVLFRRDFQRVQRVLGRAGIEFQEGQTVRCFGGIDFYPAGGRLQFIARDADPLFSVGDLARRRQETIRQLAERGLTERNGSLTWPALPLRVALIASAGSAADRDFVSTLESSRFAFEVLTLDVAVQGSAAEAQVVRALERCAEPLAVRDFAVVVLIRGGGSKTDLAAFDSLAVAEAIAMCPLPVLTGLGHEIDESVADLVAHRALKTPTAVAEFLCREVGVQDQELGRLAHRLKETSWQLLNEAARSLSSVELQVHRAARRLERAQSKLERLAERLSLLSRSLTREGSRRVDRLSFRLDHVAGPNLDRARARTDDLGAQLLRSSLRALTIARERLIQQQRWIDQLSPERTLRRGFSITRNASGEVVRAASQVNPGEQLFTELGAGRVNSTVHTTDTPKGSG